MKKCVNCGSECDENAVFCRKCGSSFDATVALNADSSNATPVQEQPQYVQQPEQPQYQPQEQQYAPQPEQPQYQPQEQQYAPQPEQLQYPPQQQQYPQQPQQQYPQPPQQQPYQYQPYQQQQYNIQPGLGHPNDKYLKLGGWLMVIVIVNIIFTVINFFTLFGELSENMGYISNLDMYRYLHPNFASACYLTVFGILVGLASEVMTVFFIVYIFKRRPEFLRMQQVALILHIGYMIFVGIIPNAMLDLFDENFAQNIGSVVGTCVGFFIFTLYMCRSVRVRTYFGSDEYMSRALFAYKSQRPLV